MALVGVVLVATFVVIAFEKLHKTLAALTGAGLAVVLALGLGTYGEHGYAAVHGFIHHDLGVIGVIVGTSIVVAIAADSGLFHFLAIKLVKATGGVPAKLFPAVMMATVGFVTFLTIAPGVLIMSSLVLVITKELDDDPRPYILAVAIGANSGALMTFASGIPTLMIGTSANIPYLHFLVVSLPLALLSAALAFLVIKLRYASALAPGGDLDQRALKVASFDEWALVKDRKLFYRCVMILGITIVGFATAQQVGVGLDFVAFLGATAALLFSGFSPEDAIKKVKWPVILFFVGLFVLIGTVQSTGLLEVLAGGIHAISGDNVVLAMVLVVPFVFVTAGIVDNIPVAATMIPVTKSMIASGLDAEPLWWSLIAACNLGGNPTPVGSIAAVIALHALEKERGIKIGWGEYLKVGGLVTVLQIVLVLAYMFAFHALGLFPDLPMTDADDKELKGNVHAFEAALHAVPQVVEPALVQRIVLGLDGSNQDDTTRALAADLARRAQAHVVPVLGTRASADEEASPYLHKELELLREAGVVVDPLEPQPDDRRPAWDLLLDAARARRAELIVLDAPYLEDFDEVGTASTGTNFDVLMARRETPLLVVRAPLDDPTAVFGNVVLPIFVAAGHQPAAASWALRAIAPQGRLGIVAAVDEELLRRADWLADGADLDTLDPETLAGLREPKNAGLIGALQRYSSKHSLGCRVRVRAGEVVPALLALAGDTPTLFVVPCPTDPLDVEFQRTQALVRASRWPVLVV